MTSGSTYIIIPRHRRRPMRGVLASTPLVPDGSRVHGVPMYVGVDESKLPEGWQPATRKDIDGDYRYRYCLAP